MLINYAADKKLNHGDALPSENELLSTFDVSRNTIRLAVDRLVKMGVAKKTRGQGTFYIKDKRALSVDYHHAFEGSAARIGLKVSNELVNKEVLTTPLGWLNGFGKTNWDETIYIRRKKMSSKELLALEERVLPGFVVKRFSEKEIRYDNISPNLIERYPDTIINRFNYIFINQPATKEESKLLNLPIGTNLLRRLGEYFNAVDEKFMFSRLTIVTDRINLRYEFEKNEYGWSFRG